MGTLHPEVRTKWTITLRCPYHQLDWMFLWSWKRARAGAIVIEWLGQVGRLKTFLSSYMWGKARAHSDVSPHSTGMEQQHYPTHVTCSLNCMAEWSRCRYLTQTGQTCSPWQLEFWTEMQRDGELFLAHEEDSLWIPITEFPWLSSNYQHSVRYASILLVKST